MRPDDKVCYCFHVSLRKLLHFARRERICRASQMSLCLNAGTGCGWCIPVLKKIHALVESGHEFRDDAPVAGLPATPEEDEAARREYLKSEKRNEF